MRIKTLAFTLINFVAAFSLAAADLTFEWDWNSEGVESMEESLKGFRLYMQTNAITVATIAVTNKVDGKIPRQLTVNVGKGAAGRTLDFAVTAFNLSDLESALSEPLRITFPHPIVSPTLLRVTQDVPAAVSMQASTGKDGFESPPHPPGMDEEEKEE
jgi:hypothetical protein